MSFHGNIISSVQGSVLGLHLFTIFVNDLSGKLPARMLKFANDAKIFCSVSSQEDRWELQLNLDQVDPSLADSFSFSFGIKDFVAFTQALRASITKGLFIDVQSFP